nr:hypothetical protein [Janibacter melonis]
MRTSDGTTTYRVREVVLARKTELDLDALFRRSGRPALHLVTCGEPSTRRPGTTRTTSWRSPTRHGA